MRQRGFWTGVLVVGSIALGGAQFRGCGSGDDPEEGSPLPEAMGACVFDADCESMGTCALFSCVSGVCVESGIITDGDGDRYAPPPCGDDCNDGDSMVFPGATELCDGVDQDCDGEIDEGAPGIRTHRISTPMVNGVIVGMAVDFALVGVPAAGTLGAMLVTTDGTPGVITTFEAASPEPRPALAAALEGDTVVVIASAGASEPPRRYELSRSGGELVAVGTFTTIGTEVGVGRIAMLVLDGQEWVIFDTLSGRRSLWRSGDAGALVRLANGTQPPVVATDGTNVAVTDGDDVVRFYASGGAEVGTQTLPGGFGVRGLASGDGHVYAAYHDAFDHALTRVTPTSFTSPTTAPFGDSMDQVQVFFTPPHVLVTRRDFSTMRAWLYTESLDAYAATFTMSQITDLGLPPDRVTTGTNGDGLSAIFGAYDAAGRASLAILQCR